MRARRPRLPHTQPHRTSVPTNVAVPLVPVMYQGPASRRCGHPDAGLHPRREAMHKQHTEPGPSCCVPFGDPHVHNVTRSDDTRQERSHNNANTLDQPTIWRGHTRPTTSPKEGKRRGYINKEFCANADLCPLASPRVALVGVACSGTPTKATRGEARGHP